MIAGWSSRVKGLIAAAMAAGGMASLAAAASPSVWNGGGSNDLWSTPENWGGNTPVPGAAYVLQFGGTGHLTSSNDFTAASNFGALTFLSGAGSFNLSGNSLTLNGSITNSSSNLQTIGLGLVLNGTRTIDTAAGDIEITGAISRDGTQRGITKEGTGTLTLSGINTFGGTSTTGAVTTVNAGTLVLNATGGSALNGAVTVNNGATLKLAGTGGNQIIDGNAAYIVTINGGATFDLNGRNESIRNLAGSGVVTNNAASTVSTLTLVENQAVTLAATLQDGNGVLSLSIGQNTKVVTGNNTYSGGTTFTGGTLRLGSNSAVGTGLLSAAANVTITSDSDTARSLANNLTLTNTITFGSSTSGLTGNLSFGATNGAPYTVTVNNAQTTLASLGQTTNGNLTKAGPGNLVVTGNSTTVATTFSSGIFAVGGTLALTNVTTFSGGVLGANGTFSKSLGGSVANVTFSNTADGSGFAAYNGELIVAFGGTASPTALTWAGDGSTNRFVGSGKTFVLSNAIATHTVDFRNAINLNNTVQTIRIDNGAAAIDARLSGILSNGSLTKTGGGTLEMSAANSYTGTTTVSEGRLLLSGSLAGDVSVVSGASLAGAGSTSGRVTVDSGATLAPGGGTGDFTAGNGLILAGALAWEHNAGNALGAGGTNFDTITITGGSVDITGGVINLSFAATTDFATAFWDSSHTWTVLNNTGSGALAGTLSMGAITGYSGAGTTGQGSFSTAAVGNDLVLSWTVIPEPTMAGMAGAVLLGVMSRRRRA